MSVRGGGFLFKEGELEEGTRLVKDLIRAVSLFVFFILRHKREGPPVNKNIFSLRQTRTKHRLVVTHAFLSGHRATLLVSYVA